MPGKVNKFKRKHLVRWADRRGSRSARRGKRPFFWWPAGARWPRVVLVSALLLSGFPLLWRLVGFFYLERNPDFVIGQVEVHAGASDSARKVREIIPVEPGMRLFGFDMEAIRNGFMADAHHVRELRMTRILPDRLDITVIERRPLGRIGRRDDLVFDDQGQVFAWRDNLDILPRIVGGRRAVGGRILVVSEEPVAVEPGTRLTGNAMAAAELLCLNEDPGFQLPLVEVDVSRPDYLVLYLSDRREILLAWPHMGAGTERSRRNLQNRMESLILALAEPRAGNLRVFDARVDDRQITGRTGR